MTRVYIRVSTFRKVTATKIALEVHICSTAGLVLFPFDKKFVNIQIVPIQIKLGALNCSVVYLGYSKKILKDLLA